MKTKLTIIKRAALLLLLSTLNYQLSTFAQGTAFTYQGSLNDGANVANGAYDLTFALFNVVSGVGQVGNTLTNSATTVSNGLFTVTLDFGANFPGADRWLEIAVRTNGGAFTKLAPRQQITSTPYAITAGKVTGSVAAGQLTGAIAPANIAAGTISSTMLAAGSVTSNQLAAGSVNTSSLADGAVTAGKMFTVTQTVSVVAFHSPNSSGLDNFGVSVTAVGTDRLLIGADRDNNDETDAGAAYLYSTDGTELTMFTKSTPVAGDLFGHSVAVAGTVGTPRLLIGAYLDDTGTTDAGAAYLFNINGGLLNTFTNPTPATGDNFGYAVAAVGTDRVLIGAYGDNTGANNAGAAYLFNINGTLLNTFTNPTPATDDDFGFSVAAMGTDLILIGAQGDNTNGDSSGAAYLFSTNGTLLTTFINPTPAAGDHFGNAVAAVGTEKVLIGAVSHDIGPMIGGTPAVGAAYLFSTNGTLLITFNNPAPFIGDSFGYSVAAMGTDQVLIGENALVSGSSARLYRTNGSLVTTFTNPASGNDDSFGSSVAAVGNRVLVGTPGTTAAYLFTRGGVAPGLFADGVRAGAITAVNLAAGAVGSDQIAERSITTVNLHPSIGVWNTLGANVLWTSDRVGIGTTGPPLPLTVAGSGNFTNDGAAAILLMNYAINAHDWEWHVSDDGRMQFVDFTTGLTRLLIDTNGSVGIGTNAGPVRLTVAGSGSFNSPGAAAILLNNTAINGHDWEWHALDNGQMQLVDFTVGGSGGRLLIDTNGNVGIGTSNPTNKLHVVGGVSATVFVTTSDRNAKENFSAVDAKGMLEKVAALPITQWNFKEDKGTPHVGPMAQDFYAAFKVGPGSGGIATVDADGVALAAIQGLNQKVEDLNGELKRRDTENADLKQRLEKLERLMNQKHGGAE